MATPADASKTPDGEVDRMLAAILPVVSTHFERACSVC